MRRDPQVPRLRGIHHTEGWGLLRVLQLRRPALPAETDPLVDAEHAALVSGEGALFLSAERRVEAAWDVPAERTARGTALTDALRRAAAMPSRRVVQTGNDCPRRHARPPSRFTMLQVYGAGRRVSSGAVHNAPGSTLGGPVGALQTRR